MKINNQTGEIAHKPTTTSSASSYNYSPAPHSFVLSTPHPHTGNHKDAIIAGERERERRELRKVLNQL
jgi:hypothetical protein